MNERPMSTAMGPGRVILTHALTVMLTLGGMALVSSWRGSRYPLTEPAATGGSLLDSKTDAASRPIDSLPVAGPGDQAPAAFAIADDQISSAPGFAEVPPDDPKPIPGLPKLDFPAPAPDVLKDLDVEERNHVRIYANANRSVVNFTTATEGVGFFGDETSTGTGSGFVIDKQGHVLTNYHVVEKADSVRVTLFDGSTQTARVPMRRSDPPR